MILASGRPIVGLLKAISRRRARREAAGRPHCWRRRIDITGEPSSPRNLGASRRPVSPPMARIETRLGGWLLAMLGRAIFSADA